MTFRSGRRAWPRTRTRSPCHGMVRPAACRAGCGEWRRTSSRSSPSTARISAVRCGGFPSRACSCVRVTAACTTRTASTPRDRRRAGCTSTSTRSRATSCSFAAAACRPSRRGCRERPYGARSAFGVLRSAMIDQRPATSDQRPAPNRLQAVALWLDERLHLTKLFESSAGHTVPASSGSWFYVFGSGTLLCFVVQVLTGICLALVYAPTASDAWTSLIFLNYEQYLGWFLRAVHNWGSNFMVAIMTVHMIQVFLFGAFKYPRELTWITGCVLLLCTLGMAFTGQVLRFDQDAYWGLGIGVAILARTPLLGAPLTSLLLGGPIIAGPTLSRFFTLHVFVIPGLIIALVSLHLRLVLTAGINEYPVPGRRVDPATYREEYEAQLKKEGVPFVPGAIGKDLVFAGCVLVAILTCAAVFGPAGPNGAPDPTLIQTNPRPDFYFLPLFSVFALLPPYTETFLMLTGPAIGIVLLFAVPFIYNRGEKSARRRPVAVISVIIIMLGLAVLAYLGTYSPW